MADDTPSPHGLAALAISASLVEALVKQGIIDQATVEAILKKPTRTRRRCASIAPPKWSAKRNAC